MNREDIIRMAREAGCEIRNGHIYNQYTGSLDQMLKRFAQLVAAAEREACVERASVALLGTLQSTSDRVLKAIRARGQQ